MYQQRHRIDNNSSTSSKRWMKKDTLPPLQLLPMRAYDCHYGIIQFQKNVVQKRQTMFWTKLIII